MACRIVGDCFSQTAANSLSCRREKNLMYLPVCAKGFVSMERSPASADMLLGAGNSRFKGTGSPGASGTEELQSKGNDLGGARYEEDTHGEGHSRRGTLTARDTHGEGEPHQDDEPPVEHFEGLALRS
jgi:hypothetical protein